MRRRDKIFRSAMFMATAVEMVGVLFDSETMLIVGLVGAFMTALLWTWMDAADASVAKQRAAQRRRTR